MTDKETEHSHNNFVETLQDEQAISPQIGLVQSSAIGEQNTSNDVLCNEKIDENKITHRNYKNACKYGANKKGMRNGKKRRFEELPDGRCISSDMPQSAIDMIPNPKIYERILAPITYKKDYS